MKEKQDAVAEVAEMAPLPTKIMANSIDMASSLGEKKLYAEQMIRSGLLPEGLATVDQLDDEDYKEQAIGAVIAVVEYGRELKITPWVALNHLHIVKGRVVMGVHMYMGLALQNNILVNVTSDYQKVYNAAKAWVDVETTIVITRKHKEFGDLIKDYTFTKRWSEIKKAGLDKRDNYVKRPNLMLRTRCITEGLRLYAADIFMGTMEKTEMLDVSDTTYEVDDDGNVVYEEKK